MGKRYEVKSGIYIIENVLTNKKYIGQSYDTHRRMRLHRSSLKRGDHSNKRLQEDYKKYGEQGFEFYLLEEYPNEYLFSMECFWINTLDTTNVTYGYNDTIPAHNKKGVKAPSRIREQMSQSRRGMLISNSHRKNMSLAQLKRGKGQFRSNEAKTNIASANIRRATPILQYDLSMTFIKEWRCMSEIYKSLGFKKNGIQNNIGGLSHSSHGYIWKYKNK